MFCLTARLPLVLGTWLLGAALLFAQAAKDALPGVDFSGLSEAQKATATKLLQERDCGCTCGMKVAECRVKDPNCSYSKGLASAIVEAIKKGKSEKEALAAADASQWSHMPEQDNRILGDSVVISTSGAPVTGPADAKVKIVEFSDFQCPYCVQATPQLQALLKAYPTQVSLTFKQFPLDQHSQAAMAALAAIAAQKQGKFWEMHDALFARRGNLSPQAVNEIAAKIGISVVKLEADMRSAETKKAVQRDMDDGQKAGVMGTPTLFVNGQRFNGAVRLEVLKPVIDAQLKAPTATASAAK